MRVEFMSDSVIFEVNVNHLCWFCDVTEKNRDASLVSTISSIHGNNITNIVQLSSPTPKKDINFIKNHQLVKSVEVLMLQPNNALLKVVSSYEAMTYKILHQTNVTLLESPVTTDGIDSEILLADSHKAMNELLSKWKDQKDYYEIKLKKKKYVKPEDAHGLNVFSTSGFFDLKAAKELLSEKQLEVFRLACDYGYYEIPKMVTIEQLAERTGIAPSTLAEHLRKAETKLLPIFWKVLKKM
ncbi:helix-turn-helix domain-containing protein [Candidatus Micrarchaeota archaeon]|nr:helix-turn-helix domain-containing protein [Candidatus Micrarchaeota archaeon]